METAEAEALEAINGRWHGAFVNETARTRLPGWHNANTALICGVVVLIATIGVGLAVAGFNLFTVLVGVWGSLPFFWFALIVSRLEQKIYFSFSLAATCLHLFLMFGAYHGSYGARSGVALFFVPIYEFALLVIPLAHLGIRVMRSKP